MKTTLVIMAAGIGSRFGGGIKQLAPVGLNGEIIMDYSIHDAIEAGFNKIVFIIRKDIKDAFKEAIGDRIEKICKDLDVEIAYAYQELNELPEGVELPAGRTKPWGTGQAVLACKEVLHEPFAVINADDYYGKEAFVKIHEFLVENYTPEKSKELCMAGFILGNTLSDNGTVTRGICVEDEAGYLHRVIETKGIIRNNQGTIDCDTEESKDLLDLKKAAKLLDEDHYGLAKIKERILEYLAVRILAPEAKAPIICFVGPPGVGKTSFARSIARALDKKFARISLGGIHDEAEIRGHRRTYIGSMPGRFIEAIAHAKTKNPLLLLDEIDKVGSDFRGDPASALLEALDPEQNKAFHDNYIDIPFDLSKVFFVATANTVSTIPAALLDRMELIELSGYTEEEKVQIAKKYLIPRQRERNGLKTADLHFTDALLRKIIRSYTREAGVRELERTIGALCRKVGKKIVLADKTIPPLSARTLEEYLGPVKFLPLAEEHESQVGRVNGLAWTAAGGEVLDTEAITIKGKGNLILTGQLGDVMKESAETAYTYIRSRAKELGLVENFYETLDTHIHLPEGAVPKDGPSAGITMATAMASAYTGRKVRGDTAMTGEITLTGEVLPIGGVKEKVLAASQFGIRQILLPEKNKRDMEEIPQSVRKKLEFIYVKNVDDVLAHALMK